MKVSMMSIELVNIAGFTIVRSLFLVMHSADDILNGNR